MNLLPLIKNGEKSRLHQLLLLRKPQAKTTDSLSKNRQKFGVVVKKVKYTQQNFACALLAWLCLLVCNNQHVFTCSHMRYFYWMCIGIGTSLPALWVRLDSIYERINWSRYETTRYKTTVVLKKAWVLTDRGFRTTEYQQRWHPYSNPQRSLWSFKSVCSLSFRPVFQKNP